MSDVYECDSCEGEGKIFLKDLILNRRSIKTCPKCLGSVTPKWDREYKKDTRAYKAGLEEDLQKDVEAWSHNYN